MNPIQPLRALPADTTAVDRDPAERAAAELLSALGVDLGAEATIETPRRMVDVYAELLSAPRELVPTTFPNEGEYDELGMEYTGLASPEDDVVLRGDRAGREFIAFWLSGGRVVAGMNVNVWDVADTIGDLIRSRAVVDPARLADADVPLEALVRGGAG